MRKRKVFRETVITVIVIAVITLDALKQCIKFENKIFKPPNESFTNHLNKFSIVTSFCTIPLCLPYATP